MAGGAALTGPARAVRGPRPRLPGVARLDIAGFGLEFESDSAGIINVLARRYGCFPGAGSRGFKFRVLQAAGRPSPFRPAVLLKGSTLRLTRGDFSGELNLATGAGEISVAPNEQCLDAFLRSLISALLLRSGGFMLHSAGLVKNGKAYLFLGRSGAGKSTLSKLAAGRPGAVEVISDEINLLRFENGRFVACGSPFWGEMRAAGRQASWPLGGICLLKKARANSAEPCGQADALKLLLRCLLNFEAGPGVSGLVLGNAARLLAKAPFRVLKFSKSDASFLELI